MKPALTQERVRELLDYDAETGTFRWRLHRGRQPKGAIAGCKFKQPTGYTHIVIGIGGTHYKAHRLAWLYVHGEMPAFIDHINGNATDNRIANLRPASRANNQANSKRPPQRSTQYRGVSYCYNGYMAQISHGNRSLYLGRFQTAEQAYEAWCKAAKALRGEFAKLD